MNRQNCMDMIKRQEGLSLTVYEDSLGIPTVGYGFNLKKPNARARIEAMGLDYFMLLGRQIKINEAHANTLFEVDFADAEYSADGLVANYALHPDEVQDVIVNMIFNLGAGGFRKFHRTIEALERMDYCAAADEMQNSLWYQQTGDRAVELMTIVKGFCR